MTNNNLTKLIDLRTDILAGVTFRNIASDERDALVKELDADIREAARGLTTCDAPEAYHPGFPCDHPPFDPEA